MTERRCRRLLEGTEAYSAQTWYDFTLRTVSWSPLVQLVRMVKKQTMNENLGLTFFLALTVGISQFEVFQSGNDYESSISCRLQQNRINLLSLFWPC